jgi:hypothetical protein
VPTRYSDKTNFVMHDLRPSNTDSHAKTPL